MEKETQMNEEPEIEEVRSFLCGYRMCADMLRLLRYERKRGGYEEEFPCEDILAGNEAYWRARMSEVSALIASMRNGREKLILYYHYVRGESIEHASDLLGISRRTGYRVHKRALLQISFLFARWKKRNILDFSSE
jgi:DNA-directed RNA polymerase specialized sigma subunit